MTLGKSSTLESTKNTSNQLNNIQSTVASAIENIDTFLTTNESQNEETTKSEQQKSMFKKGLLQQLGTVVKKKQEKVQNKLKMMSWKSRDVSKKRLL